MELEELYGKFYKEIITYCTAMTKNRASAEDLVQETYLRAFTHWEDLEVLSRGQSRAWLYKTARNLFIDQARKQSRETPMKDEYFPLAAFEEDLSQAAVTLRYFEGYNAKELGDMFDLPSATVRSRLASAKRRLRQWVEE